MRRTHTGLALAVALGLGGLAASDARASISRAVVMDALVEESSSVDVVTPTESHSVWESGRIVTYTQVHVDVPVAGSLAAGADPWVRTLGGVVGDVGQLVDGEPVLIAHQRSLLFLQPGPTPDTFLVTARGQGQYPLLTDPATHAVRVVRNSAAAAALPPRRAALARATARAPSVPEAAMPAAAVLHGKPLDAAERAVRDSWARTHAR